MDQKSLSRVEIKSEDRGEFSAVFSTFNVMDSDGDVTLPGAFDDGAEVVISGYGHTSWQGVLPVGKGRIRQTKSEAICDGQFFMDIPEARNTFTVLKALGNGQEWSYGFDVLDAEDGQFNGRKARNLKRLKVYEVSPVLRGAGINTRTLAVKALTDKGYDPSDAVRIVERTINVSEYRSAIRPHEIAVTAKQWKPSDVEALIDDSTSIEDLRSMHAWVDPNGDPEQKSSYHFLHHHGPAGEANLRACMKGIWLLNSGKSGIPEQDREAVYAHLASHLRDGDREPLELRAVNDTSPLKMQEQIIGALVVNSQLRERAQEVLALRARKGKSLAAASADLLEWWYDEMREARSVLDSPQDEASREYLRFIQSQFQNSDNDDTENPGEPE